MIPGRNGGRIKRREKGDPGEKGAGRPLGSKSFKTLLEEALSKTTKGKDGQPIELKQASALQLVGILLSSETDDNTKLKAFQIIRDTIGEAPATKAEVTGKDGGPIQTFDVSRLSPTEADALLTLMDKAKNE